MSLRKLFLSLARFWDLWSENITNIQFDISLLYYALPFYYKISVFVIIIFFLISQNQFFDIIKSIF